MKLGIRLASLGLPVRQALPQLTKLGLAGVQLDAAGDLLPDQLSRTGRRQLRHLIESHDLKLASLFCPLRRGLDVAENLEPRLDHVRKVMSLCWELGGRVVIVQPGRLPASADHSSSSVGLLTESLAALAQHADRTGTVLALETGQDRADALVAFLSRFETGGLGVHFDPHNLLINQLDPYASAAALRERIVQAQAHDARQASASRAAAEVPLGHGDIDWLRLLGIFEEIGYRDWLVIEREQETLTWSEAEASVNFLRRLVR